MKFLPFYFFMALFIGFMMIYMFGNDYYLINKIKNKTCNGFLCSSNN